MNNFIHGYIPKEKPQCGENPKSEIDSKLLEDLQQRNNVNGNVRSPL